MAKKKYAAEPTKLQLQCERGLLVMAIAVGVYHMLMSIYQYYNTLPGSIWERLDYTLFGLLLAGCAAYCLLTRIQYPRTCWRITNFVRTLLCPEMVLALVFFAWYFVSCFSADARYSGNFLSANTPVILDTAITLLIFFPLGLYLPSQRRKTVMHLIIHIIVGLMTVLMAIVLYYIFQPAVLTIPGGEIGMNSQTRLCINCNPNTTGAYAAILFMLCIYMVISQKPVVKVLYSIAALIHMMVLMLSNSITSYLAVSIFLCVTVFMLFWHLLSKKSMVCRIAVCVCASLATLLLFSALRSLSFSVFEAITHFSELIKKNTGVRAVDLDHGNVQYRRKIWGYAFKSMTTDSHRAIFGVTPIGVVSAISLMSNGAIEMYTHNQFMEIGVAMGFPGLILYFIWLVYIAINCLKVGLVSPKHTALGSFVLPVIILGLVIANLTEATLLFYHYLCGAFFFLLCGFVTAESKPLELPAFFQFKKKKRK